MKAFDIVQKFLDERHKILIEHNYVNVYYELYMCENYKTHSSHTSYKFLRLDISEDGKSILLKNKRDKIIKVLTKENTAWISKIYAVDKYTKALIANYNFAEIEVEE